MLPSYNRTGWLGIKHQVTYLPTCDFDLVQGKALSWGRFQCDLRCDCWFFHTRLLCVPPFHLSQMTEMTLTLCDSIPSHTNAGNDAYLHLVFHNSYKWRKWRLPSSRLSQMMEMTLTSIPSLTNDGNDAYLHLVSHKWWKWRLPPSRLSQMMEMTLASISSLTNDGNDACLLCLQLVSPKFPDIAFGPFAALVWVRVWTEAGGRRAEEGNSFKDSRYSGLIA